MLFRSMPTKQEIAETRPLVAELMAPALADYKAKTKSAAEVAADAGQALKEAGENAFNTLSGGFNTVKKYAGVAVAGIAGLILLKALKK